MQPDPVTIVEFLRARLAERHVVANEWRENFSPQHPSLCDPGYVLADIAAKRRIVDAYERVCAEAETQEVDQQLNGEAGALLFAVQCLALRYADQPGYREEWRPA